MVIIMVSSEEATVTVDQQGRMVLPSNLRQKLGLKNGGRVMIRLEDSSKVVIERRSDESVEESVGNWVNVTLGAREQAKGGKRSMTGKWISDEYAKRKRGL
jgi:AbrB family looped-hinge helix DNA binding protein